MMARDIDTSRARCDTCGKPYQAGDAIYSVADKFDETIEDRDVLVSFRHWDCHTPIDASLAKLRAKITEASEILHRFKGDH